MLLSKCWLIKAKQKVTRHLVSFLQFSSTHLSSFDLSLPHFITHILSRSASHHILLSSKLNLTDTTHPNSLSTQNSILTHLIQPYVTHSTHLSVCISTSYFPPSQLALPQSSITTWLSAGFSSSILFLLPDKWRLVTWNTNQYLNLVRSQKETHIHMRSFCRVFWGLVICRVIYRYIYLRPWDKSWKIGNQS